MLLAVLNVTMSYHQEVYDVKQCCIKADNLGAGEKILCRQFAIGSQARVENLFKELVTYRSQLPKTSWDHFKKILTDWVPTLNFGWLKPEYVKVPTRTVQNIKNTYYNVIPLSDDIRNNFVAVEKYIPPELDLRLPDEFDWLRATPPTIGETETAIADITEKHCAYMLALGRVSGLR